MMEIEVEGTDEQIVRLYSVRGIEFLGTVRLQENGLGRISAVVKRHGALDEIRAAGVTVRVTMDEAEMERRAKTNYETMKKAHDEYMNKHPDGGKGPKKP